MSDPIHPAATGHLPAFVTPPGGSDWLMAVALVFLLSVVVSAGLIYLRLHALPEHMAHRTQKVQLQVVGVLALLALFTHNNVFWVAALLLALVDLPDVVRPLNSMAASLARLAGRGEKDAPEADAPDGSAPDLGAPVAAGREA